MTYDATRQTIHIKFCIMMQNQRLHQAC